MVQGSHRLNSRVLLAILVLLTAAGCAATAPGRTPEGASGDASGVASRAPGGMGAAGEALLIQGANERRSGDYGAASATLERALRIEPSAPALWLELARVRLLEGNYAQAEQLARKAGSLAPAGSTLEQDSRGVIEQARQRQDSSRDPDQSS
jgi:Flp pilus assembly protein TadD